MRDSSIPVTTEHDRPQEPPEPRWRLRVDAGGPADRLSRLCDEVAAAGARIVSLRTRPLAGGPADELSLRAPRAVGERELVAAARRAGFRDARPVRIADGPLTVRPAGPADLGAARAMHARCSPGTLHRRYQGPAADADRYLDHLLDPRHGVSFAAVTGPGRLVGLGHLLWDGKEAEAAVLVEDDWQRCGAGRLLLRELVAAAVRAGRPVVYAVTPASDTAATAVLRGSGLSWERSVADGVAVVAVAPVGTGNSDAVVVETGRK